jgi:hypothetical protein
MDDGDWMPPQERKSLLKRLNMEMIEALRSIPGGVDLPYVRPDPRLWSRLADGFAALADDEDLRDCRA